MGVDNKIRPLNTGGLKELVNYIKTVKKNADTNTKGLSDLQDTVTELSDRIVEVLGEIGGAIEQLDSSKAYLSVRQEFTLQHENWVDDSVSSMNYPYKYDLPISGITPSAIADVVFDGDSIPKACYCGISSVSETGDGVVILRSKSIPESDLSGMIYITRGTESKTEV